MNLDGPTESVAVIVLVYDSVVGGLSLVLSVLDEVDGSVSWVSGVVALLCVFFRLKSPWWKPACLIAL